MRELLARLRDWLRRDRLDTELSEELEFHRAQLERDARAAGAEPDAAALAARRRLGNTVRVRERARDRWSLPWLDHLQQDTRYALRGLRRSPGFAIAVVATLALGIGANAAMIGVVDHLMFRPHPYLSDPSTVHRVYMRWWQRGTVRTQLHTEYARYLDLKKWTTSFSQFAGFAVRTMAVGVGDAARERRVAAVSATFFDFFDAPPALGRYFGAAEDTTPRGADVAILDYRFWLTEFGGRDVQGQVLQVGSISATIIGVTPKGFAGVNDSDPPALYIPITTYAGAEGERRNASNYFTAYNWGWVEMMVRRKHGVSLAQASADASRAHRQSWIWQRTTEPELPDADVAQPAALVSAMKVGAGPNPSLEARTALWVTGVSAIVLLIACANVANLLLARALRRGREIALRLALGVSRGRLIRQSMTESLVLSLIGGAAGLLVAQWGGAAIRQLLVRGGGVQLDVLTDWRTLGVTATIAIAVGVVTGLAPAFLTGRGDLARALKAGARGGTYHLSRTRSALLVLQGAMSVVLLVGAALFVKSLANVKTMRMGYDAESVIVARRNLRGLELDEGERIALRRRLVSAAQAIPGVEYASWASSLPFWSTSTTDLFVAGIDSVRPLGEFTYQMTTPDYFQTMGTRILRGRGLSAGDQGGAPRIAVVSESMAKVLWPGRDAVGQCMRVFADTMPCTTVVGIAEDIAQHTLTGEKPYHYYLPIEQSRPAEGHSVLLKVRGDPARQMESVRKALQAEMPGQSYVTVRLLHDVVDGQRRSWRLGATMFVAFGGLALLVAAVGLYGVIAYDVSQRMHELGVRIALGARATDVVRLVVAQGVRFALAGLVAGTLIALFAARWIEPLLFQESARDPGTYALVATLLLIVGMLASTTPALRATRADPNTVLRVE
jgi:predicted permease